MKKERRNAWLDIQLFQTFLKVAALENISQAAEQMNFTQPTVTAQIQTLERYFEVQLFERIGKRIFLTEAGHRMVLCAERMLQELAAVGQEMEAFKKTRHHLSIGISTQMINHLLPPILGKVQSCVPGIRVSIEVCKNATEVIGQLLANQIDLGIIHGEQVNAQVVGYNILREPIAWVVETKLHAQYGKSSQVLDYPIINFTRPGSVFRANFDAVMKDATFVSEIEFSDSEAVKQAALNGLGAAYLPKALLHEPIASGALQVLQGPAMHLPISVVLHKNKQITPALRGFLGVVADLPDVDPRLCSFLAALE